MSARQMEAELGLYWRLSRNLAALRIAGVTLLERQHNEVVDDLEVLAEYSDWPLMRAACQKAVAPEAVQQATA